MINQDFVPIPVPRHLVMATFKWLASHAPPEELPNAEGISDDIAEPIHPEMASGWTPTLIARMVAESPDAMKNILECLAEQADREVPTRELAKSIKHKPDADSLTVAGTLGAFGRRTKNRYGQPHWPFQARWDHSLQCYFYSMSSEVAADVLRSLKKR